MTVVGGSYYERVTIKYDGRFYEFAMADLDLPDAASPTDADIQTAVIGRLAAEGVPSANLAGFVIDPPESERQSGEHDSKTVLNIRPTATFG